MAAITILALLGDGQPDPLAAVELGGAVVRVATTEHDVADALGDAQVVVMWDYFTEWLRPRWKDAERLEWIHVAGAGVESVLFPELVQSDVVLTNARGAFDRPIAEYVLALILAQAKDLRRSYENQSAQRWERRITKTIDGASLLVIGPGSIGRAVARLGRACGMSVTAVGRSARRNDPDFDRVEGRAGLQDALAQADYVVITAPLTDETRRMLGAAELAVMRPGAYLINVARGPIVDEAALVAALQAGTIGGAALDVFAAEPLPQEHRLWTLPNVVVSPHMSAAVPGNDPAVAELFLDNLQRWQQGQPLRNIVDKRLGFVVDRGRAEPAPSG